MKKIIMACFMCAALTGCIGTGERAELAELRMMRLDAQHERAVAELGREFDRTTDTQTRMRIIYQAGAIDQAWRDQREQMGSLPDGNRRADAPRRSIIRNQEKTSNESTRH